MVAFVAVLVWGGHRIGAVMALVLVPVEIVFWVGFALPVPPIVTTAAMILLGSGASHWSDEQPGAGGFQPGA